MKKRGRRGVKWGLKRGNTGEDKTMAGQRRGYLVDDGEVNRAFQTAK